VAIRFERIGTKERHQHRNLMDELDEQKKGALVVVSLSTATLIAVFGIALALF
jgi:hypothetical protein